MPPPTTPLGPTTPASKLKRGHETRSFPAGEAPGSSGAKPRDEMRQAVDARERAAVVLGSWEQLSWHSHAYRESVPQTRLRFEKMMIGLEAESGEEEWEDEGEGGEKGKERGKEEKGKRAHRGDGNVRKSVGGKV